MKWLVYDTLLLRTSRQSVTADRECQAKKPRATVRSTSLCRTAYRSGAGLTCIRRIGATSGRSGRDRSEDQSWVPGPDCLGVRRTGSGPVPVRPGLRRTDQPVCRASRVSGAGHPPLHIAVARITNAPF